MPCENRSYDSASSELQKAVCAEVSGTPNYMAPEVLQCALYEDDPGEGGGYPVDLWVFCV